MLVDWFNKLYNCHIRQYCTHTMALDLVQRAAVAVV